MDKPRVVVLTKSDLLPPEERETLVSNSGLAGALVISAHSGEGLRALLESLWRLIVPQLGPAADAAGSAPRG
jgi:50S ribosomal subunit-associated GTPase HflX